MKFFIRTFSKVFQRSFSNKSNSKIAIVNVKNDNVINKSFSNKIVRIKDGGNTHRDLLKTQFPLCTTLFFDNLDKNYMYYMVHPTIFPNLKTLYTSSIIAEYDQLNRFPSDFKYYFESNVFETMKTKFDFHTYRYNDIAHKIIENKLASINQHEIDELLNSYEEERLIECVKLL
jgi:hypothetical protein